MPVIPCPHCGGRTMHDCASCGVRLKEGICKVCGGDGRVTIPENAILCPHCGGKTMHDCASCMVDGREGICKVCNGKGRLLPG